MKKSKPTFVSFFSGIEGFRVGLEAAGWECVHSVEIDDFCGRVQEARYGHGPESKDINAIVGGRLPEADLWVAGWPCQGLSVAGLRKGLADDRSGLFWEFVRLLEQKRPRWILAENVPGLLTTCSCSRCGFQCKDCAAPAGADDEACQMCGSERLGGRVLPAHRGTDLFVVLTALQRIGYGVQERILDAQYIGVPQRRRRLFFVGHLGAPCPPEVLFEPEGGHRDLEAGGEEGAHAAAQSAPGAGAARRRKSDPARIAGGELARALGGVGGGQDYGANKGTLVPAAGPEVAGTLQSCAEGQGRKTPEVDQLVAATSDKAHTVSKGTGGGLGGRDGQDDYVIVEGDSASSTPKLPRLRAGCGRAGETHILRIDQTRSDPLIKSDVTDSIATGTGHGGYANQAVARQEPEVFEPRCARNGRGMPDKVAPALKAENGSTGKGDGAPCVIEPKPVAYGISPDALDRTGEGEGGSSSERSGLGISENVSPSVRASHAPAVAAPLTAGSNPNSNAAGRRREDDENIVVAKEASAFQSRYYTRGGKAGGKPSKTTALTSGHKQGDSVPMVTVAPCLDTTFNRTGRGRTEAERLVAHPKVAPTVTHHFERTGGETEASRLVQQPLFIHTADAGSNQGDVKEDGKADCLSKAQPGAVAFDLHNKPKDKTGTLIGGHKGGGRNEINSPLVAMAMQEDKQNGVKLDDKTGAIRSTAPGSQPGGSLIALDWQSANDGKWTSEEATHSIRPARQDAVAYNVKGGAQGGESHAYETQKTGTVDTDGRNPSGNEAGTLIGEPVDMAVRRLTPTECERLQGFPDGWTCVCGTNPKCELRRVPPWLDAKTFRLGGCGHSGCGCTCADSPRYKSLGNAVATCAVTWIGRRLGPVVLAFSAVARKAAR